MCRGRVISAACALLALGAAPAFAGGKGGFEIPENQYEGRLDRGDRATYVGFNLERGAKPVVRKVAVSTPFSCAAGNSGFEQFPVRGRFKVDENGTFGDRVRFEFRGVPIRVKFEGQLKKRGRATGEFKFVARPDDDAARGTTRCSSQKLNWRAKRGKEVRIVEPPA